MRTLLLVVTISIASVGQTSAQSAESAGDFAAMESTWADEFTVNSPRNRITRSKADVPKLIRAGGIGTYAMFVREAESVTVHQDVAVAMPGRRSAHPAQPRQRRRDTPTLYRRLDTTVGQVAADCSTSERRV